MVTGEERERLREAALAAGACAAGFVDPYLPPAVDRDYAAWIAAGNNATMRWLSEHQPLRADPATVLPGVRTVISLAFPYLPAERRDPSLPYLPLYAYGRDYHKALRSLLRPFCSFIEGEYGVRTRVCVDSAPVHERAFALRAGIGRRGLNGCVITPRHGSFVFLAEVFTTLQVEPDDLSFGECLQCGRCVRACPAGALNGDGTMDAARCINYLTIEHPYPLTPAQEKLLHDTNTLVGCDRCQTVCPLNRDALTTGIPDFQPRREVLTATTLTRAITPGSPLRRALK